MQEQFIPYELALELKELGFEEECLGYWYNSTDHLIINNIPNYSLEKDKLGIGAPLWQQGFNWFRQKYNINASIIPIIFRGFVQSYEIYILIQGDAWNEPEKISANTFEEIRLSCLQKIIELCREN